jgi:hypothetical protein
LENAAFKFLDFKFFNGALISIRNQDNWKYFDNANAKICGEIIRIASRQKDISFKEDLEKLEYFFQTFVCILTILSEPT